MDSVEVKVSNRIHSDEIAGEVRSIENDPATGLPAFYVVRFNVQGEPEERKFSIASIADTLKVGDQVLAESTLDTIASIRVNTIRFNATEVEVFHWVHELRAVASLQPVIAATLRKALDISDDNPILDHRGNQIMNTGRAFLDLISDNDHPLHPLVTGSDSNSRG